MSYTPLPPEVKLGKSKIQGKGIIASKRIPVGYPIGASHVWVGNELWRSPLGGFVNHSCEPNCELKREGAYFCLVSIKEIQKGHELTLDYGSNECGGDYDENWLKENC